MKYTVSRSENEEKFDEIDFAELRARGVNGQDSLERMGPFVRVTSAKKGTNAVFGISEMENKRPGERRFAVATALGNFTFSVERSSQAQDLAGKAGGTRLIRSSMPGRVVRVLCKVGDDVMIGQPLLVLEAMKMENEISSPVNGKVEQIDVAPDKKVETGESLVKISS